MRLKSYFADTIEEAIGQARRELRPEAMLVNSKRSGAEARQLGMYEVICAGETGAGPATREMVLDLVIKAARADASKFGSAAA